MRDVARGMPASKDGLVPAVTRRLLRSRYDPVLAAQDVAIVALCFAGVLMLRYEAAFPDGVWAGYLRFLPFAVATFLIAHSVSGLYAQIWRHASIDEARRVVLAGLSCAVLLTALVVIGPRLVPSSVAFLGSLVTTMLVGGTRFQSRLFALRRRSTEPSGLRVVVLGAGETGAALVRQMRQSPRSGLVPVALLDDNPRTHGKTCLAVPVRGPLSLLPQVTAQTRAHQVVLAIPSAPAEVARHVVALAEQAGVALRVVPAAEDIVRTGLRLQDLREIRIDDLLGRPQVRTDLGAIREFLTGRRILITGAGGSIGSEIARQVTAFCPERLLLLDHDETHLHEVATTLSDEPIVLLADIRDRGRIGRLFREHRPEIVFHAAAHKHVPMLEVNAGEAFRTNVLGTINLMDASVAVDVSRFVLISTDKAVRPTSVMGATKRLAEQLLLTSPGNGHEMCAVRFGNVLGSRGSVIPTFVRQIENGGPVTVTDARMTRYFMSIPEAVQLVLAAAAMASGREIFMLDMGEPVRIIDLAKKMIRLSGRRLGTDIELRLVGMRPGEKLVEELRAPRETTDPTTHASIVRVWPGAVSSRAFDAELEAISQLCERDQDAEVRIRVLELARSLDEEQTALPAPRGPSDTIDLTTDLTGRPSWT